MCSFIPHCCDFCRYGIVWPIVTQHEPLRLRGSIILIDGFIIGKCNGCSHRYLPAHVVKKADRVAEHSEEATGFRNIPVVEAA